MNGLELTTRKKGGFGFGPRPPSRFRGMSREKQTVDWNSYFLSSDAFGFGADARAVVADESEAAGFATDAPLKLVSTVKPTGSDALFESIFIEPSIFIDSPALVVAAALTGVAVLVDEVFFPSGGSTLIIAIIPLSS